MPSEKPGHISEGNDTTENDLICPEIQIDLTKLQIFSCTEEEIKTNIPHINIQLYKGAEKSLLMLDCGAEINLLKKSCLPEDLNLYKFRLILKGICGGKSLTLGIVKCKIGHISTIFHVIDDDDQIKCDGILGAELFRDSKASILFDSEKLIINGKKINFVPTAKSTKSTLDMINSKLKQQNTIDSIKIPELEINIINPTVDKVKNIKLINL